MRSSTTRRIPASLEPLLLDSGGFTELKHHGRWRSCSVEQVLGDGTGRPVEPDSPELIFVAARR